MPARPMDERALAYDGFDPREEGLREALTSTGNGYFCTRGAAEWEDADDYHYPGTYAHGLLQPRNDDHGRPPGPQRGPRQPPQLARAQAAHRGRGRDPAATTSSCSTTATPTTSAPRWSIRELRFRDRAGRETTLRSRRFMSMAHSHQAGLEWTLTAENWSGSVEVVSALDGRVTNGGVARYGELEGRHLDPVSPRTFGPEIIALQVETRQSNIYVAQAARTRVLRGGEQLSTTRSLYQMRGLHPAGARLRRRAGRAGAGREARLVLHLPRPRDQRAADERRQVRRALPGLRRGAAAPHPRLGRAVALQRRLPAGQRARPAPAAPAHLPHPAGLLAAHDQPRCRRPRARPQRRGLPRPRLLGRALRLPLPHLAPAGDHARADHVPLPAPRRGARGGPRAPATRARCSPGRAAATAARRRRSSTSTRSRASGIPTSATASATSTPRSSTTSGTTTRRPTTSTSCATTARRSCWRSRASGRRSRTTTPSATATRSTGSWARTSSTRSTRAPTESGLRNNAYTNIMVAWICEQAQDVLGLLTERRRETLRAKLGLTDEEIEHLAAR